MERYIQENLPHLRRLIRDLCAIPAPSHEEDARAAFVKNWLEEHGAENVWIDEAKNVIWPVNVTADNDVVAVMAHTDTVFPDREPMPFRETDGRYYCPGVTDDTAQLAVLLISALYYRDRKPDCGMLFVANACEEGLGNLKGSRAIVARYGGRLRELVTVDGCNLHEAVSRAVGSHRYRVKVRTQGGHSFGDFGRANAIHQLAKLIDTLYTQTIPVDGESKTTYNVGQISGGTSVNTIAQEAEMLYEYRSDSRACLDAMEQAFRQRVEQAQTAQVEVLVEKIGDRPCAAGVDPVRHQALLDRAGRAIRQVTGREPLYRAGSTDCNAALGAGIPAVCIGGCVGGGCHTREEYVELDSLEAGCRLVITFLADYYKSR